MNLHELTIEQKLELQRRDLQRKKNAEYSRNYRLRKKENEFKSNKNSELHSPDYNFETNNNAKNTSATQNQAIKYFETPFCSDEIHDSGSTSFNSHAETYYSNSLSDDESIDSSRYIRDSSYSESTTNSNSNNSSFESNSEDYVKFMRDKQENPFLYPGSDIKLQQFCVSFLMVTIGDRLSRKTISKLLLFINSILPADNKVPTNYNRLLKTVTPDENLVYKACKLCYKPSINEICDDENCQFLL